MKHHWVAALLCIAFAFVATGCGTPRAGGTEKKSRRATTQTGTNIPRWQSDATSRDARAKQRAAKAKREKRDAKKPKAEKPKRERKERRPRATDDEVITRGGFR